LTKKIALAPGRVNLIGEHTDYNGLPVLPTAIDKAITFEFFNRSDTVIQCANVAGEFEPFAFNASNEIVLFPSGHWGNYVKAAVWGLIRELKLERQTLTGFEAVVSGNIPPAAGLSSSSALVVAAALAFVDVNGLQISPIALAELLARAEKFVGTQGGGMDQAISLMGQCDHALKIDFFPLRKMPVAIPADVAFVLCNSLVKAAKAEKMKAAYNRRTVECRLATAILSKAISQKMSHPINAQRLGDLLHHVSNVDLMRIAREMFTQPAYRTAEIQARLDSSVASYLTLNDGSLFPEPADGFKLYQRVLHVLTEAARVEQAVLALSHADTAQFGRLMNESHASCRDYYEISCPQLERLVDIATAAGAIGARLTGAGFGGCTVNLLKKNQVPFFIKNVSVEYYEKYLRQSFPDIAIPDSLEQTIFAVTPSSGAQIRLLDD